MGPVSGFLGAMIVIVVWRVFHWPYLRETSGGVLFLLMTSVTAYRNGSLKAHPLGSLSFVAVFKALGAAIGHIPA